MPHLKHYYRPKTLDEALALASQADSLVIAGGALTLGGLDLPYESVVDLQDIAELKQIDDLGEGYRIGAGVTLQQVAVLPGLHPVIKRALTRAIPLNIRNNATILESLICPNPPLEWWAVLAALDAGISRLWPDGKRDTRSFADTPEVGGQPSPGGILTHLTLAFYPQHQQALGASFVARTPADEPIVCAAVYVRLDAGGLIDICFPAVGGIVPNRVQVVPYKAEVLGQPLNEALVNRLVESLTLNVTLSDYRGSAEYRSEMARVCIQRALLECLEQLA